MDWLGLFELELDAEGVVVLLREPVADGVSVPDEVPERVRLCVCDAVRERVCVCDAVRVCVAVSEGVSVCERVTDPL